MRSQGGAQPLQRSQSARVPIQGHARQRSVGRWDDTQPPVAFSSSIVSPCLLCFGFQGASIGEKWGTALGKDPINLQELSVAALGLVCNPHTGFVGHVQLLFVSNVQYLEIGRFYVNIYISGFSFKSEIGKILHIKPAFPCGSNWLELRR